MRSGELGLRPRADVALMKALVDETGSRRIQIVGPSGAGKTSLILRVVADLAQRQLEADHEVLILRVGDRPESLASPEEVMKLVLDTIATYEHRFANIDPDVLRDASASERTRNPTEVSHQGGIDAQLVSYSATVREAYETVGFAQNPARVRSDLEDVIRQVRDAGYRPALVLDDTEKFVSQCRGVRSTLSRSTISTTTASACSASWTSISLSPRIRVFRRSRGSTR